MSGGGKPAIRSLALAALAGLMVLSGCKADAPAAKDGGAPGTSSLAAAIATAGDLSTVAAGLKSTGLASVFDGNASYTVLAPTDAAFKALGEKAGTLTADDNRAALAAVLRDHIVPGTLTPADIKKALEVSKGDPVKMRTVGNGELSFARAGDAITVTGPDGAAAKFAGDAVTARNGVAIPIDAVLKKL